MRLDFACGEYVQYALVCITKDALKYCVMKNETVARFCDEII